MSCTCMPTKTGMCWRARIWRACCGCKLGAFLVHLPSMSSVAPFLVTITNQAFTITVLICTPSWISTFRCVLISTFFFSVWAFAGVKYGWLQCMVGNTIGSCLLYLNSRYFGKNIVFRYLTLQVELHHCWHIPIICKRKDNPHLHFRFLLFLLCCSVFCEKKIRNGSTSPLGFVQAKSRNLGK